MVAPSTDIYLFKNDLELDEKNQLRFNTWNDQWSYFMSLPKLYLENATYQRKDNVIRYPNPNNISYDDLCRYNYCCYKNEAYANKTFFAYIKNMRYVNDGMTEIEIETDPWQSWMFDVNYKVSFIEREHVSNDSYGANTIPEGFETGEYVEAGIDTYTPLTQTCPVLAATLNPHDLTSISCVLGAKYEGCGYFIFKIFDDTDYYLNSQLECLNHVVHETFAGKPEAIVSIFMCPRELAGWSVNSPGGSSWQSIADQTVGTIHVSRCGWGDPQNPNIWDMANPKSMTDFTFDRKTTIGTFTPHNKKTLCFPYSYVMLTNNSGGNVIYHYEDFAYTDSQHPNQIKFNVKGTIVPGCSIRAIPNNYKKVSGQNYSTGLSAGKLPICSWQNDIYTNWLTQNGVNFTLSAIGNVGMMAGGVGAMATGFGVPLGMGMIAGGAAGVLNDMKEIYQHSLVPPQLEGDVGSAEIAFADKKNTFEAHHFRIKEEYARIIDGYFDTYGYKVNAFKVPNIHTRRNWNYIKTIDINITGDIPSDDLEKIKELFNNGITFWHNPSTFLDYSQSNSII